MSLPVAVMIMVVMLVVVVVMGIEAAEVLLELCRVSSSFLSV